MTRLDQKLDVGIHERDRHGDGGPIGQDKVGILAELLDDAEDVVPSSAVETRAMLPQLEDDLHN